MSHELYQVASWEESDDNASCDIHYDSGHAIFRGHFPGNPIVPGVCTLQMIMELMERAVGKSLRLVSASNVKYLQLITPDIIPQVALSWTGSGISFNTTATLKNSGVTLFKLSAQYGLREP